MKWPWQKEDTVKAVVFPKMIKYENPELVRDLQHYHSVRQMWFIPLSAVMIARNTRRTFVDPDAQIFTNEEYYHPVGINKNEDGSIHLYFYTVPPTGMGEDGINRDWNEGILAFSCLSVERIECVGRSIICP